MMVPCSFLKTLLLNFAMFQENVPNEFHRARIFLLFNGMFYEYLRLGTFAIYYAWLNEVRCNHLIV